MRQIFKGQDASISCNTNIPHFTSLSLIIILQEPRFSVETKQGSKIRHGQKGEGDIRINNVEDVPYPFEGMVA